MKPVFVVVIGGSGSGKNYYISHHPEYSSYRLIDVDVPVGEDANLTTRIALMKKDLKSAFEAGESVAHPTTGSGLPGLTNKLKLAADYGYETRLVLIDTDPKVAASNLAVRVAGGGHGAGIPQWKVEKTNAAARESFDALRGQPFVDSAVVVKGRQSENESIELLRDLVREAVKSRTYR